MKRTATMTIRSGDIAAVSTSAGAMSMPVWLEQLPQLLAPWVALGGFALIIMTAVLKFYEIKAARLNARRIEEEVAALPEG